MTSRNIDVEIRWSLPDGTDQMITVKAHASNDRDAMAAALRGAQLDALIPADATITSIKPMGREIEPPKENSMKPKTAKIDSTIEPILRQQLKVTGDRVEITSQLDRTNYVAVNKVLEALGGKWDRKARAHIFPRDAQAILDEALGDGQTEVIDTKKTLQQFDTPAELAFRMAKMAELQPDDSVLEPSAGNGALVMAAQDYTRGRIVAIELDPQRASLLHRTVRPTEVHCADFVDMGPTPGVEYDAVIMNPPFIYNQDIAHVRHAWQFLKPGGRLVAIVSAHSGFASDKASVAFREWLSEINATVENLHAAFVASGTQTNTRLIFARKPAAEKQDDDRDYAVRGYRYEQTEQGPQAVIPGTGRSARQASAARGPMMRHSRPQRDPGGLFEPAEREQLNLF